MDKLTLLDIIIAFGLAAGVLKFFDWYIGRATEAIRSQICNLREDVLDIHRKFDKIQDKLDNLVWHRVAAKEELDGDETPKGR